MSCIRYQRSQLWLHSLHDVWGFSNCRIQNSTRNTKRLLLGGRWECPGLCDLLRIETLLWVLDHGRLGRVSCVPAGKSKPKGNRTTLGSIPNLLSQDSSNMKRGKILLQQIQKYELIWGSAAEPQIFSHVVEIRVYRNFFSSIAENKSLRKSQGLDLQCYMGWYELMYSCMHIELLHIQGLKGSKDSRWESWGQVKRQALIRQRKEQLRSGFIMLLQGTLLTLLHLTFKWIFSHLVGKETETFHIRSWLHKLDMVIVGLKCKLRSSAYPFRC